MIIKEVWRIEWMDNREKLRVFQVRCDSMGERAAKSVLIDMMGPKLRQIVRVTRAEAESER